MGEEGPVNSLWPIYAEPRTWALRKSWGPAHATEHYGQGTHSGLWSSLILVLLRLMWHWGQKENRLRQRAQILAQHRPRGRTAIRTGVFLSDEEHGPRLGLRVQEQAVLRGWAQRGRPGRLWERSLKRLKNVSQRNVLPRLHPLILCPLIPPLSPHHPSHSPNPPALHWHVQMTLQLLPCPPPCIRVGVPSLLLLVGGGLESISHLKTPKFAPSGRNPYRSPLSTQSGNICCFWQRHRL